MLRSSATMGRTSSFTSLHAPTSFVQPSKVHSSMAVVVHRHSPRRIEATSSADLVTMADNVDPPLTVGVGLSCHSIPVIQGLSAWHFCGPQPHHLLRRWVISIPVIEHYCNIAMRFVGLALLCAPTTPTTSHFIMWFILTTFRDYRKPTRL